MDDQLRTAITRKFSGETVNDVFVVIATNSQGLLKELTLASRENGGQPVWRFRKETGGNVPLRKGLIRLLKK